MRTLEAPRSARALSTRPLSMVFGDLRNRAIEARRFDWIFSLDADGTLQRPQSVAKSSRFNGLAAA